MVSRGFNALAFFSRIRGGLGVLLFRFDDDDEDDMVGSGTKSLTLLLNNNVSKMCIHTYRDQNSQKQKIFDCVWGCGGASQNPTLFTRPTHTHTV